MRRPRLIIYGVPKDLEFSLIGFDRHLTKGGEVVVIFNGDGRVFVAKKWVCKMNPLYPNGDIKNSCTRCEYLNKRGCVFGYSTKGGKS